MATTVKDERPDTQQGAGIVLEDAAKSGDGVFATPRIETILVSVVIPALNEKEGIVQTIQAIPYDELEKNGCEVQVIVVDNGSDDGTGKQIGRASCRERV